MRSPERISAVEPPASGGDAVTARLSYDYEGIGARLGLVRGTRHQRLRQEPGGPTAYDTVEEFSGPLVLLTAGLTLLCMVYSLRVLPEAGRPRGLVGLMLSAAGHAVGWPFARGGAGGDPVPQILLLLLHFHLSLRWRCLCSCNFLLRHRTPEVNLRRVDGVEYPVSEHFHI